MPKIRFALYGIRALLMLSALCFLCIGCGAAEMPASGINSEELARLKVVSLQGDGDASMRLYSYYTVFSINPKAAANYVMIAAENGNAEGQLEVASILLSHKSEPTFGYMYPHIYAGGLGDSQVNKKGEKYDDDEVLAKTRAIYWLKLAAAKGNVRAKALLKQLTDK